MVRFSDAIKLEQQTGLSSNPAAGQVAIWSDPNNKLIAQDNNGNKNFLSRYQSPDFWQTFGHSYFQYLFGTFFQTGRADALLRAALDIEFTNWRNRAVNGAAITWEGRQQGGWVKVMQEMVKPQRSAPYVSDGGATLIMYGINDIGATPSATQAQIRTMFSNAMRAVVSRCRASVFYDNGFSVGTRTSYGAGFAAQTGNTNYSSSAGTLRRATSTTSATITLTLPSDYNGETVVVQFVAEPGTPGGTVSFSGTAGVTGTLTTLGVIPSGAGQHTPVVRRITGLTSSNAGQTIIMTATSVTTQMYFDGWWLEAHYPPPVIVANAPRVLTAGYSGYANGIGDTDITSLNSTIASVVAEFDGMVQLADCDSAINKDSLAFGPDGLHPNEIGAAKIVDAYLFAISNLVPTTLGNPTLNMNVSSPRAAAIRKPRVSGLWYGVDAQEPISSYVPVSGDLFFAPFIVTEGREKYVRLGSRINVGATPSAATFRWGVYDDIDWKGGPQCLIDEATKGGVMSTGTTAGSVLNPSTGTGAISWELDPGLYWMAFLIVTTGTDISFECFTGPDRFGIMPQLNPGDLSNLANPIAWVIGGQSTSGLPAVAPSTGSLFVTGSVPKMGLQVA